MVIGNKTMKTNKEKKYWVEYKKFLAMIHGEVFLQYLNMKHAEDEYIKEYKK